MIAETRNEVNGRDGPARRRRRRDSFDDLDSAARPGAPCQSTERQASNAPSTRTRYSDQAKEGVPRVRRYTG